MVEIFWTVAAFAVGVLSAARLTRLVMHDSFPPAVWFRIKWDDVTEDNGWNPLFHCHWCLSPWMTLIILSLRRYPLPSWLARHAWIDRLHNPKTGVPYGIALAVAALLVYPETLIFRHFAGA